MARRGAREALGSPDMAPKLCPKVILEGTRLTLKTEIAFALNEHPRIVGPRQYRYHSPLISAEWCGFSDYPWGHGPINYAAEEEGQAMEVFSTWARLYQRQAGRRDPDFSWLDRRLLPLGFRHVLCTRRPETFEAARVERLKVSGMPSQYDDLGIFIREQDHYRRLVAESTLPWLELDVSDGDPHRAADRIADWLEATDGLSPPWGR